jgi:rhodanese-related sulfurtransferase
VAAELSSHGVVVETGVAVSAVTAAGITLADGREINGDIVVGSIGVRPDVRLAELAGLALSDKGGIAVDETNRTSDEDVYAVGDAVAKEDWVGGGTSLIALANIANRQGRRVADHICGLPTRATPSLGTAIVKVFDLTAAATGWNEKRLRAVGRKYRAIHSHPMSHAGYYPGAQPMSLKLLFDPDDGTILGAQAVGKSGVDKRIDVIATAITGGITADELADLELAYSPPFSSAKDPVNMLGYMAENVRSGACDVVEYEEVATLAAAGWTLIDVRTNLEHARGAIPGSVNLPLDELREELDGAQGPFVVYCEVGQRGHTATALLQELGFEARNLDGGYRTWVAADAARAQAPERLVKRAP